MNLHRQRRLRNIVLLAARVRLPSVRYNPKIPQMMIVEHNFHYRSFNMNKNKLFIYFSDYLSHDTIFSEYMPTINNPCAHAACGHIRVYLAVHQRKAHHGQHFARKPHLADCVGVFVGDFLRRLFGWIWKFPKPVIRIFAIFLLFWIGLQGGLKRATTDLGTIRIGDAARVSHPLRVAYKGPVAASARYIDAPPTVRTAFPDAKSIRYTRYLRGVSLSHSWSSPFPTSVGNGGFLAQLVIILLALHPTRSAFCC
jgi:hypothetical protein